MSGTNGDGIIKIGRHGMKKLQFDEGTEVVDVDVIHVSNLWAQLCEQYIDDKGEIKKEMRAEYYQNVVEFACSLLKVPMEQMTLGSALHLLKVITDEATKLRPFFEPESSVDTSSPRSVEVSYST